MSSALSQLDNRVSSWLFSLGTRVPRIFWKVLEYSGDGIVWLILAVTLVGVGISHTLERKENVFHASKRVYPSINNSLVVGFNLLVGLVIDLIEVGVLKMIFKRPRPHHNKLSRDMNVLVSVDAYSFPSGHSSRASFIAQFALLLYPEYHSWKVGVIIWACVVAQSRCMMGRHYCSDVLAGLLLGYGTIMLLTKGGVSRNSLLCRDECIAELLSTGLAIFPTEL